MISRSLLRSPLLALVGATGALFLVACSDAATSSSIPARHRTTTGSTTGGDTTGTGGGTNGTPANAASGSSSGGAGSSSGGTSSGSSGSSSGGTDVVDSGPPVPADPSFDLAIDNASPVLKLDDQVQLQVTVTPTNNWTGAVTLSLETLPTDVTASFDNATVNLGAAASIVKLTLKSVSSTASVASPISIVATAGVTTHKSPASLTVQPEITINIPVNADSLRPGFGTIKITPPADISATPVVVHFLNLDSTPHEIHAGNAGQGFPHGDGTFGQNQVDPKKRAITATGDFKFYLHDEGPGLNEGVISIQ